MLPAENGRIGNAVHEGDSELQKGQVLFPPACHGSGRWKKRSRRVF